MIMSEGGFSSGMDKIDSKNNVRSLQEIEKEILLETLRRNKGNIKKTAEELGIARSTVYNKLKLIYSGLMRIDPSEAL